MAIREFGESLLADVRARKDQQVSDQRKEDKREEKRQLFGEVAKFGINQIGGAIRNNMEAKTKDFLNKSEYGNTSILLNTAGSAFEQAYQYESDAKKAKTGIYDVVLKELATQSTIQQKLDTPFVLEGEGEELISTSYFMQDPKLQELARERTAYYKKAIKLRTDYNRGKSNTPLVEFGKEARPASWTKSLYNKITGNAVSGDRFNTEMAELEQVVASKSLMALQMEAIKNNVLAGDVSAINARKLIPNAKLYLNDPSVIAAKKRGEVVQFLASASETVYHEKAFYRTTARETTDLNGDTRVASTLVKVMDIDEKLTPEKLVQLTGVHETLISTAKSMLNNAGFADFNTMLASDFQASGKKEMDQEFISLMFTRLNALDFTNKQNVSQRINPEEVKAVIETYDLRVVSLNLGITLAASRLKAQKDNATEKGVLDETDVSYQAALKNFNSLNAQMTDLHTTLKETVGGTGVSEVANPLSNVSWGVDKNLNYESNSKGKVSFLYNEVTRQRIPIQTRKDDDSGDITYYLEDPSGQELDITNFIANERAKAEIKAEAEAEAKAKAAI